MKILFIGDSITDVGRNVSNGSMESLGQGYPLIISAKLGKEEPMKYSFINVGISGNRIVDLYARIKSDVWNQKPDIISILIGVNDVWHDYDNNGVEADRFETIYRMFIADTKKQLPNVKFIIIEPFLLNGPCTQTDYNNFRSEVIKRANAAKKIAKEFDIPLVSLQKQYDNLSENIPTTYWLADGVHPTPAGHQIIADEWIKVFNSNYKGK